MANVNEVAALRSGIVKSLGANKTKNISNSIKNLEKSLAMESKVGLEAQGNYAKADIVKKEYTKPELKTYDLNTEENICTVSNNGDNHGYTGGGTGEGEPEEGISFTRDFGFWGGSNY